MNLNPNIYILYNQLIYLIIFHPTPLVTLIKWTIVFAMGCWNSQGSETHVYNVVFIRDVRHANVDKQSKLLAEVDVTLRRGAV